MPRKNEIGRRPGSLPIVLAAIVLTLVLVLLTQQALAGESLLLLEEGHCLRDQALDICHRVGMSEAQDVRATSLETLRQMVKAGTGITLMPRIAISPDETGICYIPVEPAPQRHIGLVWRKTTARQALLDVLVSITSDTVAIR